MPAQGGRLSRLQGGFQLPQVAPQALLLGIKPQSLQCSCLLCVAVLVGSVLCMEASGRGLCWLVQQPNLHNISFMAQEVVQIASTDQLQRMVCAVA